MKYRYSIRQDEWDGSADDWEQLVDYARNNFSYVVVSLHHLYFNATPRQLQQAANALRIGTTYFNILTTSSLEPSTHST